MISAGGRVGEWVGEFGALAVWRAASESGAVCGADAGTNVQE